MAAKLSNAALGAMLDPPLTSQQVGRLRKRGMPGDLPGARDWRARVLDQRYTKDARIAPACPAASAKEDVCGVVTALLAAAGERIVAGLSVECDLPDDVGSLAVSVIAGALHAELEARAMDGGDLYLVCGPLSGCWSPAEIEAARRRIERHRRDLVAELAALDALEAEFADQ